MRSQSNDIFTTVSCEGVKQIFLGIALVYISERKSKFVKLSAIARPGEVYSEIYSDRT
jgi:hypothetical protein